MCCFASFNRLGKLELKQYGMTPVFEVNNTHRFTSSFSDFKTRYTAVSSTNLRTQMAEYYALDPDDALTMNLGTNPMLQCGLEATRKRIIERILNELAEFECVPFNSTTIGNPTLDVGDVIVNRGGHADVDSYYCVTEYECKMIGKISVGFLQKKDRDTHQYVRIDLAKPSNKGVISMEHIIHQMALNLAKKLIEIFKSDKKIGLDAWTSAAVAPRDK